MHDDKLEDWFYRAKSQRKALEAEALAHVTQWVWLKGLCNGLNPEPYRWQRRKLPRAIPTGAPGKSRAARKNHHECGLDAEGRIVFGREWGNSLPYVNLWFYLPGRIRGVRFSYQPAHYHWVPTDQVCELELDGKQRVVEHRSYANGAMWPSERPLLPRDIPRLKRAEAWQIHDLRERFVWKGDRLVRVEEKAGVKWAVQSTFEYATDGKLVRIWRKNHTRSNGKEVMWGKRF